jgi:hypothetical protein
VTFSVVAHGLLFLVARKSFAKAMAFQRSVLSFAFMVRR